jgi:hypothetical protein
MSQIRVSTAPLVGTARVDRWWLSCHALCVRHGESAPVVSRAFFVQCAVCNNKFLWESPIPEIFSTACCSLSCIPSHSLVYPLVCFSIGVYHLFNQSFIVVLVLLSVLIAYYRYSLETTQHDKTTTVCNQFELTVNRNQHGILQSYFA